MTEFSYTDIVRVLMRITQNETIKNSIHISGGIVPWLISGTDSNRKHNDLDLLVSQENMPLIRDVLRGYGLYNESLDSLSYSESKGIDYGIDTYVDGVPIGFYPYEQTSEGEIIQRSFSPTEIDGQKDLKTKIIPNINIEDYFSTTKLPNGTSVGISSLEIIKATKEKAGREKDLYDIKEIDRIGIDPNKYQRVKPAIDNMSCTLDDRDKGRAR